MEETVMEQAEVTTTTETSEKAERTFTQEEVNKIISDRLKRESAKHTEEGTKANEELESLKAKLSELETKNAEMSKNAEIRELKERISAETGVPTHLLTAETEEACKKQAEDILAFSGTKNKYPQTKDGGEVSPTAVSKADILAIKNEKERLKAIREHIELFK